MRERKVRSSRPGKDAVATKNRELRKLRSALRHARATAQLKDGELKKLTMSHGQDGLQKYWLVKVMLSRPLTSARGFANSFKELFCDLGTATCSSFTIGRIRDAFCAVVKAMNHASHVSALRCLAAGCRVAAAQMRSEGALGAATGARDSHRRLIFSVSCLLLHDEAKLRLRSFMPLNRKKRTRGRGSSVMQYVVKMLYDGEPLRLHTELDALGQKDANTIATALLGVLRNVANMTVEALGQNGAMDGLELWYFHVIVGDGIATNEAACKRLLAECRRHPLWGCLPIVFLCFVLKCMVHQANLALGTALEGQAAAVSMRQANAATGAGAKAATGAEAGKHHAVHKSAAGTCVRIFKFLACEQSEEMDVCLANWIHGPGGLKVVTGEHAKPGNAAKAWGMRLLYGDDVFPHALLSIIQNDMENLEHVVPESQAAAHASDPVGYRQRLCERVLNILRSKWTRADESPTKSRFLLSTRVLVPCCQCMCWGRSSMCGGGWRVASGPRPRSACSASSRGSATRSPGSTCGGRVWHSA